MLLATPTEWVRAVIVRSRTHRGQVAECRRLNAWGFTEVRSGLPKPGEFTCYRDGKLHCVQVRTDSNLERAFLATTHPVLTRSHLRAGNAIPDVEVLRLLRQWRGDQTIGDMRR